MKSHAAGISAKAILLAIAVIFTMISLSGCTTPVWYHRDQKDPLNFQSDLSQCEEDVAKFRAGAGKEASKSVMKDRMKECMKTRGYGWGTVNDVPDDCYVYEDKR